MKKILVVMTIGIFGVFLAGCGFEKEKVSEATEDGFEEIIFEDIIVEDIIVEDIIVEDIID